jgi:hypothetical protein
MCASFVFPDKRGILQRHNLKEGLAIMKKLFVAVATLAITGAAFAQGTAAAPAAAPAAPAAPAATAKAPAKATPQKHAAKHVKTTKVSAGKTAAPEATKASVPAEKAVPAATSKTQ